MFGYFFLSNSVNENIWLNLKIFLIGPGSKSVEKLMKQRHRKDFISKLYTLLMLENLVSKSKYFYHFPTKLFKFLSHSVCAFVDEVFEF